MGRRKQRQAGRDLPGSGESSHPKEEKQLYSQKAKVGQILNDIPVYEYNSQFKPKRQYRGLIRVTNQAEDLHFFDRLAEFLLDEEGDGYWYHVLGTKPCHCHFEEGKTESGFLYRLWDREYPVRIVRDLPVASNLMCPICKKEMHESIHCPKQDKGICRAHCLECKSHRPTGGCSYKRV